MSRLSYWVVGVFVVLSAGCSLTDNNPTRPEEAPEFEVAASTLAVQDETPRVQRSFDLVARELDDSELRLIVAVKEPGAARGVSADGRQVLPKAAEQAVLAAFASLSPRSSVARDIIGPRGESTVPAYSPFFVVKVPGDLTMGERVSLLDGLAKNPFVDYVEADLQDASVFVLDSDVDRAVSVSPSAAASVPWGVDTIRAPMAWGLGYDGSGSMNASGFCPELAIIDSGIDKDPTRSTYQTHPDFGTMVFSVGAQTLLNKPSCNNSADPCYYEDFLHGTGVAGMAVARDGGTHSKGVAYGTGETGGIYMRKVNYENALGNSVASQSDFAAAVDDVIALVNYGANIPVGVTSSGFNDTDESAYQTLRGAFQRANAQNKTLWFAAAGNDDGGPVAIPGRFPEVAAVSALSRTFGTTPGLRLAPYTSTGTQVEFTAPGTSQLTSWNRQGSSSGLSSATGTSYAAPIAAGVALLLAEKYPGWSASSLRSHMQTYARDVESPGRDVTTGYGIVDAVCILQAISACPGEGPLPGVGGGGGGGGGDDCEPGDPDCCDDDGGGNGSFNECDGSGSNTAQSLPAPQDDLELERAPK